MNDNDTTALKSNVKNTATWLRLVYMAIVGVGFYLASGVGFLIALFQLLSKIFTGNVSQDFAALGANIGLYLAQVLRYVSYASEDKPFPFAPFPVAEQGAAKIEIIPPGI